MYFAKEPSKKYKSIALNLCRSGINDSLSQALCKCTDWVSFKRISDEECETSTITWMVAPFCMFVTQTVKDDKQLDWWNWLDDTSRYSVHVQYIWWDIIGLMLFHNFLVPDMVANNCKLNTCCIQVEWFNREFFRRCCQLAVRQHYRNLWINVEIFY